MKKVTVKANDAGLVVVPSNNNPEFGYIRLEQKDNVMADGWLRPVVKSTILKGAVADLKELGFTPNMTLDGKIQIIESATPTNPNNLAQDAKVAGESKVPCTIEGEQIYRTSIYTLDMEAVDTLVAHDNKEAITLAQAELAKAKETANLD